MQADDADPLRHTAESRTAHHHRLSADRPGARPTGGRLPSRRSHERPPGGRIPRRRTLQRGVQLSRKQLIGVTLLLGLMTGLGPATVDMYLPALPQLSEEFMVSTASVQATLTGSLLGMAAGQLIIGPLSDMLGRRRPVIIGVSVHVLSALATIIAPSIGVLMALRVLQGFGAAAGAITSMAIVRDLFAGRGASTMFSRLMLVTGVAPVISPALGGFLMTFTGWRGIFAALAIASTLVVVVCSTLLPETLPPESRIPARPKMMARSIGVLVRDRVYAGALLTQALMFAASFSYVSGMSFILQEGFGLSAGEFGYLFSAGTFGMIGMSQVNPVLLKRLIPGQVLLLGLAGVITFGLLMTALTSTGVGGMWGLLIPIWGALAFQQLIVPNTQTIALTRHGERAGTASAFLTASMSLSGALAAPLLGLVGATAVSLSVVMLTFYLLSATATALLIRRSGIRESDAT